MLTKLELLGKGCFNKSLTYFPFRYLKYNSFIKTKLKKSDDQMNIDIYI